MRKRREAVNHVSAALLKRDPATRVKASNLSSTSDIAATEFNLMMANIVLVAGVR